MTFLQSVHGSLASITSGKNYDRSAMKRIFGFRVDFSRYSVQARYEELDLDDPTKRKAFIESFYNYSFGNNIYNNSKLFHETVIDWSVLSILFTELELNNYCIRQEIESSAPAVRQRQPKDIHELEQHTITDAVADIQDIPRGDTDNYVVISDKDEVEDVNVLRRHDALDVHKTANAVFEFAKSTPNRLNKNGKAFSCNVSDRGTKSVTYGLKGNSRLTGKPMYEHEDRQVSMTIAIDADAVGTSEAIPLILFHALGRGLGEKPESLTTALSDPTSVENPAATYFSTTPEGVDDFVNWKHADLGHKFSYKHSFNGGWDAMRQTLCILSDEDFEERSRLLATDFGVDFTDLSTIQVDTCVRGKKTIAICDAVEAHLRSIDDSEIASLKIFPAPLLAKVIRKREKDRGPSTSSSSSAAARGGTASTRSSTRSSAAARGGTASGSTSANTSSARSSAPSSSARSSSTAKQQKRRKRDKKYYLAEHQHDDTFASELLQPTTVKTPSSRMVDLDTILKRSSPVEVMYAVQTHSIDTVVALFNETNDSLLEEEGISVDNFEPSELEPNGSLYNLYVELQITSHRNLSCVQETYWNWKWKLWVYREWKYTPGSGALVVINPDSSIESTDVKQLIQWLSIQTRVLSNWNEQLQCKRFTFVVDEDETPYEYNLMSELGVDFINHATALSDARTGKYNATAKAANEKKSSGNDTERAAAANDLYDM